MRLEALKAQAVCARTYAWRQIRGSSYSEYGAHVDDSTSFQVYNNTSVFDTTDAAVNETFGQMLPTMGSPSTPFTIPPPAATAPTGPCGETTVRRHRI